MEDSHVSGGGLESETILRPRPSVRDLLAVPDRLSYVLLSVNEASCQPCVRVTIPEVLGEFPVALPFRGIPLKESEF